MLLLAVTVSSAVAQEYDQARGVIHLGTTVSDGDFTPEEMAAFLVENEIEVGVFTDHDTVSWDYRFFPTKWLLGKCTGYAIASAFGRSSSVHTYGPEKYVGMIEALDDANDDVILLPGVKAMPLFYWEGSLLFNTLSIHNVYRHLSEQRLRQLDDR